MKSLKITTTVTKVIALVITVVIALSLSINTVKAEDALITTETSHDILVTGTAPSHFTVALPTAITLNTDTKRADYEIKVKGAISPKKTLNVTPRDSDTATAGINFDVTKAKGTSDEQSIRIDVAIENNKTDFEYTEIDETNYNVVPCTLTASTDFDAGVWSGILTYDITLADK